jgi:hypothetical protein
MVQSFPLTTTAPGNNPNALILCEVDLLGTFTLAKIILSYIIRLSRDSNITIKPRKLLILLPMSLLENMSINDVIVNVLN